jgi:hypothetical protein
MRGDHRGRHAPYDPREVQHTLVPMSVRLARRALQV